jgi:hypothetical protein
MSICSLTEQYQIGVAKIKILEELLVIFGLILECVANALSRDQIGKINKCDLY